MQNHTEDAGIYTPPPRMWTEGKLKTVLPVTVASKTLT